LLITVDAGNLWHAAEEGVLQPVKSNVLDQRVPEHLRDPEGHWYGVTVRARTIVYNTQNVSDGELSTYEDLASEKWKGRLCLRTSKKVYNQSLVAMMISRHGEEKTSQIVKGWVDNLALPPFSNDTKTIEAVLSGQCDVAIVNTYYFGRLEKKGETQNAALFWPNQESSGVHVNISGIGLTGHAPNKEKAIKFLEWMVSDKAQSMLANLNMEYPVASSVESSDIVKGWGSFKSDDINLAEAGRLQAQAVRLMDKVGYK
jgi:iron(III) transport system substrate-binding protein